MQTLQRELKNIPTDTSQVHCSIRPELNRDQSLSVQDKVLICNIPEVNQLQTQSGDLNLSQQTKLSNNVFVLSMSGKPLMPCSPQKARKLLKGGQATVKTRFPFTIQLTINTSDQVQEVSLGIDSGFKNIGFSAITNTKELISGTLILDDKTKERLDNKRMCRRHKRNKLRYRKPRFLNRKKKDGWLPPSIDRRYKTHLNLIEKLKKLLPISSISIEVAKFDIQKLMNPNIKGKEYQQGNLYNYNNLVSYLQTRQDNICPYCMKEFKGESKATNHIYQKGDKRRSDKPDGLLLLHKKCHINLHERHREKEFQKPVKSYKQSIFMSIINKRFLVDIPVLKVTYGYITQMKRNELNIEKTHYNDAFIIAGGDFQLRCKDVTIEQKHRNNRVIQINRKGYKPSIRRKRYKIQPKDLFWIKGKFYICKGIHSYGKYIDYINGDKKKCFNTNLIQKYFNFGSFVWNIKNRKN